MSIGLGALLGLGAAVRSRAGLVSVIQEVEDGAVVTTGTVLEGAALPGTDTGTADLVTPTPTLPTTETLVVAIDGGADLTVTFSSPADLAGVIAEINAVCGAGFADASTNYLRLTSPTTGPGSSISIRAASTSLVILGFTAGIYQGSDGGKGTYAPATAPDGSTSYAVYYEFTPNS